MTKPVIVLGGGGHAKVLIAILRRLNCRLLGIVDPNQTKGQLVHGLNVLGPDNAIFDYSNTEIELVNGVGSLPKDKGLRACLFNTFNAQGYRFKTVIDPTALIAEDVELSHGVQVMTGVIIQVGAKIAENTILNSGAIIEHDCRIGRHVHIGTGATIIQGISIGANSIIGAGSAITQDIAYNRIVYPPRPHIESIKEQ